MLDISYTAVLELLDHLVDLLIELAQWLDIRHFGDFVFADVLKLEEVLYHLKLDVATRSRF